MVKRAAKLCCVAGCWLLLSVSIPARGLPDYQIGEVVGQDIAAPAPMTVVDPAATETLRQSEAARAPAYFRFYPGAADEVDAAFRKVFAISRERFLTVLEKTFATNRLNDEAVAGEAFRQFGESYAASKRVFPGDPALYALWARGEPADALADALAAKLRAAMMFYIRPNNLPPEIKASTRVRVLGPADAASPTALSVAENVSLSVARAKLITVERARTNLVASFAPEQQPVALFLAGFLRTNCTPDIELSLQSRAQATAAIVSTVHYEAGQLIVRRGEVVTVKTKVALDEAQKLVAVQEANAEQLAEQQIVARQTAAKIAAGKRAAGQRPDEPSLWPWIVLALLMAGGLYAAWKWVARQRRTVSMLPVKFAGSEADGMVIACPTCAGHIVVPVAAGAVPACGHGQEIDWQRRALLAEQRAEQATAIVRKGLMGQLARFLTQDFTKKLISQRAELIDTHHQAANEMDSLAQRLEKLEGAQPKEYYEQRIAELEKQLATKTEENRALLQARIEIARKQMAEAKNRVDWN
jgi:hypothetical protein